MSTPRIVTPLLIATVFALTSLEAASTAPAARPGYSFLRWQENWSVLPALAERGADPFDPLKFIPLNPDRSHWLSLGGDFRARLEGWRQFNFGAPRAASHDDTFLLTRFRAHADLHLEPALRLFAEVKGAYASDRDLPGGVRAVDQDKFELQQLFLDLNLELGGGGRLVLRPGRQALSFGAQRLVSPLPWANSLRTWDGLSAIASTGPWNITAFHAAFVPVARNGVGHADNDERLAGIYARRAAAGAAGGSELYALRNDWERPRLFNGTVGPDRRWTIGWRQWGALAPRTDYEFELTHQLGRTGSGDVSAWSFASQLGYQLRDDKSLRLWAGFDWASGDRNAGGDVETFNPLYPLGHAYFGAADMIGRQNILDLSTGAAWKVRPAVTVNLAAHAFRADRTSDAIYNAGGGVVRAGGSFRSSQVGCETDVVVSWKIARHLAVEAGYAHFFAGDAIRESGPARDIDFGYASTTFTF